MNLSSQNVAWLCSQVDLSQTRPAIDLSDITFFEPFGLVYLGMFLRHWNAHGKGFEVVLPRNQKALRYISTQNFWQRFNFDPKAIQENQLRRFSNSTSLNDIVDIERRAGIDEEIARQVRGVASCSTRVDLDLLEEMVAELVSNFARHAQGPLAALAMQHYPKLGSLRLAIGDCGIGIRQSLGSNPKYADLVDRPHYVAAWKAFEAGVSRGAEGGLGLTVVMSDVEELKGRLMLATGDGYVRRLRTARATYGQMRYDLTSVQIEIDIPTR